MSIMNKLLKGVSALALVAGLSEASQAQQVQGLNSQSGLICSGCTITNPTITGTMSLPSGATITSSGYANAAAIGINAGLSGLLNVGGTYTTINTSAIIIAPNYTYSSTGNGIQAVFISPTLTPIGASSGNIQGTSNTTTLGTSSTNISLFRGQTISLVSSASYSGTVTEADTLYIFNPANSGSNIFSLYNGIQFQTITNTGIGGTPSSGTETVNYINIPASTVIGSSTATVAITDLNLTIPSGSFSGNTNIGLKITGNGGAASTNWAINSTSNADSQLTGGLDNTPIGANTASTGKFTTLITTGTITAAASGTITSASGTLTITSGGGTTLSLGDTAIAMPNVASSAAALDAVCWNSTGGIITHNGAGALCSASLEELKDIKEYMSPDKAMAEVAELKPFWGKFKDNVTSTSDHRVHAMFGARYTEKVDPRLAAYDDLGNIYGVRYLEMSALNTAAIQNLNNRLSQLEKINPTKLSEVPNEEGIFGRMFTYLFGGSSRG